MGKELSKEEILSAVTSEPLFELQRGREVQMIRPSEAYEAMEIYVGQEKKKEAIDYQKEIERLKGLIQGAFYTGYWHAKNPKQETRLEQFKTENNL